MIDLDSREDRIEGVKGIMARMMEQTKTLQALVPEYNWTGNPLGDFGELLAIEHYSLKKAPIGTTAFDATTSDGKTVSIKANQHSKQIGIRKYANKPKADLLLVIHVNQDVTWDEVYHGDLDTVIPECNWSGADTKWTIGITKLKKIQEAKKKQEEIEDE